MLKDTILILTSNKQGNQSGYLQLRETEFNVIEREIKAFNAAIETLKKDCFKYKNISEKIKEAFEIITIVKTELDVEQKTIMHTSIHRYTFVQTSIVTLTATLMSTKQYKSIKCIMRDKEVEDAKPSEGPGLGKWIVIKELILAIFILAII
ncbi:hypothetical protein PMAC_003020 [Pneumocystis sp. 'macacae']|nr:hypothetical protein PMAC_003020 [Pneumocystis sp. 'macacae']